MTIYEAPLASYAPYVVAQVMCAVLISLAVLLKGGLFTRILSAISLVTGYIGLSAVVGRLADHVEDTDFVEKVILYQAVFCLLSLVCFVFSNRRTLNAAHPPTVP